jgi:RimJ/RimL family protein N-acetyltransferase
VQLERWDPERHTAGLVAMNRDPEVLRFIGPGQPLTEAQSVELSEALAAHWERFGYGLWALVTGERDERSETDAPTNFLGFAGLSHPWWWPEEADNVEVGWRLRRDAWGHGYATQAARAALELAFGALGLQRVVSYIDVGNTRSEAVAQRLGMTLSRTQPHPRHAWKELSVWELLRDPGPAPTGLPVLPDQAPAGGADLGLPRRAMDR